MSRSTFIIIAALFALEPIVSAHSIHFEITRHTPVVSVNAYFTRTSPLAGANVVIYAPGGDQPYQTGQTDRRGFFVFLPSVAGEWVFEIDDKQGHRNRVTISVDESFINGLTTNEVSPKEEAEESYNPPVLEEETASPGRIPLFYRVLSGLALIFGITGIFYGIRAKQSAAKKE